MALDLYRVCFVMSTDKPGAPRLQVDALVNAPTGHMTGHAEITQAIASPGDSIYIQSVTGRIQQCNQPPRVRLVHLTGTYAQAFPPPAIGVAELKFECTLFVEADAWKGEGSFSYGTNEVDNVPVSLCKEV